uniref:Predicted protein n=1 Tax=Hordeum vulgare subsp. vulgare TaxID=112509 RepID=F2EKZ7_HORVV|nr:predicted protein [Hordeum vulgare subsp. vulgare]
MPLFKRTPFFLLDPPKDLDPKEKVFQVRFTKEIFRDYQYPLTYNCSQLIDLYLIISNQNM